MEPVVFMEVKRRWSEMASHVHAGFVATGSGYVSQLRAASDAVDNEAQKDLDRPTDELIKSISSIAQEMQEDVERLGADCNKSSFAEISARLHRLHSKTDEIEKTKKQVYTQLDGL
eukprot:7372655-Pyramimonas_sp.AAC.1